MDFTIFLAFGLFAVIVGPGTSAYILVGFSFGYPVYYLLHQRWFVYNKENKIFLLGRHYHIDDDKLTAFMDDETESPIKLEHFVKVYKNPKYALLYLSKASFVYLPKDSFEKETEYEEVINLV